MILAAMMLLQADPALETRYDRCVDLATSDAKRAEAEATAWRLSGGKYFARQCLGIAYANEARWTAAADEFTAAAQEAEVAKDARAGQYWAQAGNARLASGEGAAARAALDAAIAAATLKGLALGEVYFDRGRSFVLLGSLGDARRDIDQALKLANDDPLVWLGSAALARRMGNLARAKRDIGEAYARAKDDPSVMVEIGNIAALDGDSAGARSAWEEAIRLQPGSEAAALARDALKQFDNPPPKP